MSEIFVTAEIGTNWKGDFGILEKMLQACQSARVDAVKFQTLSKEILARHPEISYYKEASLNPKNIFQIADMTDHYELEYYTTITDTNDFDFICQHLKSRIKIRTLDSQNRKLIKEALKHFDQVIVSSIKPLEIDNARIKNLYCIPRYPVEYGEINFNSIPFFDGYSNHCRNLFAILKAVKYKPEFLEFHITPNSNDFCLDNSVSFNLTELDELMYWIRRYENRNNY